MPVVNPGIRRFLGSAIQRLFNGASFSAPLTHSLVLERGTGSPTYTRASTATVMGYGPTDNAVDGLKLLTVAANEARFVGARRISEGVWSNTFADGSLIPAATNTGYLAEGARTNLCLQSNAFTTTWTNANLSVLAQNATGPDGATGAWTATDAATGVNSFVSQAGIVLTSGSTYTASLFVKKTSGAQSSYPVLLMNFSTTGAALCTIDTSNGVATVWTALTGFTIVASSATCASFNADFWRVSLVFTANVTNTWNLVLYPSGTTNATQSTGTTDQAAQGSAVFYGAQVELGSFASSYIPTTTIAVARNADVLTYSSAGNVSGTVGWCYAEVAIPTLSGQTQLIAGASVNSAAMYISSDTKVSIYDNTAERKGAAFTASSSVGKLVTTWGGSESKTAFNGTASAALGFDGDLNYSGNLQIGAYAGASAALPMFGTIRNVRIGQRALSSSELQAVTA